MYCVDCQRHLSECDCPDKEERVRKIAAHPNILIAKCGKCGELYPLCSCRPTISRRIEKSGA